MKSNLIKKLVLNKRTIANLGKRVMAGVRAGDAVAPTDQECVIPVTGTECTCLPTCDLAGKTIPESRCTC